MDAEKTNGRRPGRPPRQIPNLGLAQATSADDAWLRAAKALDDGLITVSECLDIVRIIEKRLPLCDAVELRRELELVRERQRQSLPAAKQTLDASPEGAP